MRHTDHVANIAVAAGAIVWVIIIASAIGQVLR